MSGPINETGRITMRVDKVLEESMVTKILDAVENVLHRNLKSINSLRVCSCIYSIVVALALAVAIIPIPHYWRMA